MKTASVFLILCLLVGYVCAQEARTISCTVKSAQEKTRDNKPNMFTPPLLYKLGSVIEFELSEFTPSGTTLSMRDGRSSITINRENGTFVAHYSDNWGVTRSSDGTCEVQKKALKF